MINVKIYNAGNKELPEYESALAAGLDLRADFSRNSLDNPISVKGNGQFTPGNEVQTLPLLTLEPLSRALIPTGIYIALPEGYEAQIRPRSGLAWKEGISVCNAPGTIDADYRGEIMVNIINLSNKTICIEDNERIAQMIISKIERMNKQEVFTKEELGTTKRGEGGHGSTGK